MKNYIMVFLILLLYLGLSTNVYSKSYAILISGGYGVPDDYVHIHKTAYWHGIVLAYEYLIEEAGYSHDDIYVFFGDGKDWDTTDVNDDRYELPIQHPDPDWPPDIVDYPNIVATLDSVITNFADNIITNKDNLLIWLPRGHGIGSAIDSSLENYAAIIYRDDSDTLVYDEFFSESIYYPYIYKIIYDVLVFEDSSGNKKYKRKKILWSTCRSGHVIAGYKTLLNGGDSSNVDDNKTIVFTSSAWNDYGKLSLIDDENNQEDDEWHSGFTYAIYCTLFGENPWGGDINFYSDPDSNEDGVISMAELFETIEKDSVFLYISWDYHTGEEHVYPQKADPCPMAEYLYMDEDLELENATLSLMQGEEKRYYRVDKITAGNNLTVPDNSKIEFVVDTEVRFKPGFHAEKGSYLHAFIGEIECP